MMIKPMIPIWLMGIICVVLLIFKRKGTFNYIRQIIIVVLLFVVNLRITITSGEASKVSANVDVTFIVDNTISILAEDYNGNERRLDAVKAHCKYITEQLNGASFSVISFDNEVKKLVPFTIDNNMANQAIKVLNGQTQMYARGTSLNDVLGKLGDMLESSRETYKVVFFISDGEITNSEELKSFPGLKDYLDTGVVLGYGTEKGAGMRPISFSGDPEEPTYLEYYDDDFELKKAISKIDEGNLKSIANDFGVDYVHVTKQSDIEDVIDALKDDIEKNASYSEEDTPDGYTETYFYWAIPLVCMLIFDCIYYRRKV